MNDILNKTLFHLSGNAVTVATLCSVALVIVATFLISWVLRRALVSWFGRRGVTDDGTVDAVGRLLHYAIMFIGVGVSAETIGLSLGALFTAGAVFAVGLGFAMQNIAQNFVSGVILLAERAVKSGDVLEVEGTIVRVVRLGIRSTIVQTRDGQNMILPNSQLVQSTVTNYTLGERPYRVRVSVGVSYASKLEMVESVLNTAATKQASVWQMTDREHQVVLVDFGDSSVVYEIAVWHEDPWDARTAASELRNRIWDALKQNGIVIAFPQLDVHFTPALEDKVLTLVEGEREH